MTREEKIKRGKFFFTGLIDDLEASADLILKDLNPDSNLDKEKIINDFLLKYYNRGNTQTQFLFPCPTCGDGDWECPTCDLLMERVESYKK